jgi:ABC-type branched-subunit amino acid transport system ATPase component/ABC-type branched-subunit amino acid transport system permease subunit
MSKRWPNIVSGSVALFALTAPFLLGEFAITLMNYIGIYSLAALGLVLLTGVGGLTSFGQAAFVGLGAYATAWYTTAQHGSPWLGLILSLALTGTVASILGAATLRLGGHFLPLSTIAWGIAIYFLFGNFDALGRYSGLSDIPPITLGPVSLVDTRLMYYFIWVVLGLMMLLCANLLDSREGRAIRSLRGGGEMVESLGIGFFRIRLAVFIIAGLLAGLSGWLYAHMQRFVSPAPFDIKPGIELLLMAIVGGSGQISGAVVGAAFVTLLKNALQDILPAFTRNSSQLEIVVFGALFIAILQTNRAGIVPLVRRWLPRPAPPLPARGAALPRRAYAPGSSDVSKPLLQVDRITKRFGGLVAVSDISFEVKSGEILGLIGPNGAGKTTLFNLITGVLKPDGGRIMLEGTDITALSVRRIAAKGVARTFQHVKLRPHMSLIDNVVLGCYLRTTAGFVSGALRIDRIEEQAARLEALQKLQRVGLKDKANELAGDLPLGQQRLLEIARALATDPKLLILDEPAAGLRRLEKQTLATLLRELRDDGLTIVLVEHDMDFVMNLVDRVVVMDFGVKLAEDLPAAIRADARVQEAYLGGVA